MRIILLILIVITVSDVLSETLADLEQRVAVLEEQLAATNAQLSAFVSSAIHYKGEQRYVDVPTLQNDTSDLGSLLHGYLSGLAAYSSTTDTLWVVICTFLVLFMQAGFAMLEAGACRYLPGEEHHLRSILLKNLMDTAVGALMFFFTGWAFAFGAGGPFIGGSEFLVIGTYDRAYVLNQFSYAATSATIMSGALIERANMRAYLTCTALCTGFIYCVPAHWLWSGDGFLSVTRFLEGKSTFAALDIAGSGIVHLAGGTAALCALKVVGNRPGRFDPSGVEQDPMEGHSDTLTSIGTFILYFGWYGFNSAGIVKNKEQLLMNVIMTTTISGCTSCVCALVMARVVAKQWCLGIAQNGLLAGLVGITASCALVNLWDAFAIGVISGLLLYGSHMFVKARFIFPFRKVPLDDPIDVLGVHMVCGGWGMIACGFFAHPHWVNLKYGTMSPDLAGVFYGGSGVLLGSQLLSCVCIFVWTFACTYAVLATLTLLGFTPDDFQGSQLTWPPQAHDGQSKHKLIRPLFKARHPSPTVATLGIPIKHVEPAAVTITAPPKALGAASSSANSSPTLSAVVIDPSSVVAPPVDLVLAPPSTSTCVTAPPLAEDVVVAPPSSVVVAPPAQEQQQHHHHQPAAANGANHTTDVDVEPHAEEAIAQPTASARADDDEQKQRGVSSRGARVPLEASPPEEAALPRECGVGIGDGDGELVSDLTRRYSLK